MQASATALLRPGTQLRDIDPGAAHEIVLVAQRMRDTLIEVEGEARGAALYPLAWLEDRVRWHLDARCTRGRVLLGLDAHGDVAGHTIFRIEGRGADRFGLISTTYVVPQARRQGLAARFLRTAEAWFRDEGVDRCGTWTSATNTPLIALYMAQGYAEVDAGPNDLTGTAMVKLAKQLGERP